MTRPGPRPRGAAAWRVVVDVGNTHTVIGLFRPGAAADPRAALAKRWRLPTRKDSTDDEIRITLHSLLGEDGPPGRGLPSALASVVPRLDGPWSGALRELLGREPEILDHRNCLGLRLDYDIPSQIGADRLANVLGAHALGFREGVVVDLGTATTFDVFGPRSYAGGAICPGIHSSMAALAAGASRLSEVELRWPERAVGRTTEDGLRAGLLLGALGQVEYLLGRILAERRMRAPAIIATGGLAAWLRGRSRRIGRVEPDLTLIGLDHLLTGARPRRGGKGRT